MQHGKNCWEVSFCKRILNRFLIWITAVNVFVTPKEEHSLGNDLWLYPETGLHMAQ